MTGCADEVKKDIGDVLRERINREISEIAERNGTTTEEIIAHAKKLFNERVIAADRLRPEANPDAIKIDVFEAKPGVWIASASVPPKSTATVGGETRGKALVELAKGIDALLSFREDEHKRSLDLKR
jgi:DNA-binding Lrp family transcriptional regulator